MTEKKNKIVETIDVSYIASLCKLNISEEEKKNLQENMNNIVHYINMLSEVDVSYVDPTMYASDMKNVWREDEVFNYDMKNDFFSNAPANIDEELLKVPQVIPGEEEA